MTTRGGTTTVGSKKEKPFYTSPLLVINRKIQNLRYKKKVYERMSQRNPTDKTEYTTDLPILVGIGVALLIVAVLTYIPPFSTWINDIGSWLYMFTFFFIIGGVVLIAVAIGLNYQNRRLKSKVTKAALMGDYGGRVKLEVIADDFNLSHGDMRRLLTDLRLEGQLRVSFDAQSGEVVFPGVGTSPAADTASTVTNGHVYCSYCGLQLSKDSVYCPGCGANLH